jgi:hypothetical protein
MPGTTDSGDPGGCLLAWRTARKGLFVIEARRPDNLACFGERSEPLLVQALVSKLPIKFPNVYVQRRLFAWTSRSGAGLRQSQHLITSFLQPSTGNRRHSARVLETVAGSAVATWVLSSTCSLSPSARGHYSFSRGRKGRERISSFKRPSNQLRPVQAS